MSPQNSPNTSPTGRDALRQRQQAAANSDRRVGYAIKVAWITGLAVIALLVGISVWSIVGAKAGSGSGGAVGALVAPAGATDSGAVLIGKPEATVTVAVYLDFMCPYCGRFDAANSSTLAAAVDSGTAKVEIHPMAFLDDSSSGTKYSTRAANAFVAVANHDPATALAFSQLLFANQPAEGSAGLSDARLGELAAQAGAPAEVVASFANQTYQPWVAKITQQAFDSGIKGTPTVQINGQVFNGDLYTDGPLAEAIRTAANG